MTTLRFFALALTLVTCPFATGAACSAPPGDGDGDGSGAGSGDGDGDLDPFGDGDGDGDINIEDQDPTPGCGNGELTEDEACDDGNLESGDGCLANCRGVEAGFICRVANEPCEPYAKCGDGIKSFPELCDDENLTPDDGCSEYCKVEVGWKCEGSPSTCSATICGDGVPEGAELCDDNNAIPFDGCSVDCQIEPSCAAGGGCSSACGDGIVLGDEGCDDANDVDGDGCSSSCQPEPGYTCDGEPCEMIGEECVLRVPAIFRDFPDSHVDMQKEKFGQDAGMVGATLDSDGKPTPASPGNVTALEQWYRDGQGGSTGPFVQDLVLFNDGMGNFVNRYMDDGTRWLAQLGSPVCQPEDNGNMQCPVDGNPAFFPLDGISNPADTNLHTASAPVEIYGGGWQELPGMHNFSFTTEVAYWFIYDPAANARLTFVGDDDVWVFINGHLAVDIGNLHPPRGGRIELGATNATIGYSTDQAAEIWSETTRPISEFGLTAGEVYEIKVFHAERQVISSSFQLTLAGFDTSRSLCLPECGDGILGVGEECDDGVNDGGYNECQPGCILGGYCGDGVKQEDEACDDNDPEAPGNCQGCRIIVVL